MATHRTSDEQLKRDFPQQVQSLESAGYVVSIDRARMTAHSTTGTRNYSVRVTSCDERADLIHKLVELTGANT